MTCTHATLRSLNAGVCVLCDSIPVEDLQSQGQAAPHPDPDFDDAELMREALAIEASILQDSFADFAARFWPVLTGLPFPKNAATDALSAALQAVADGRIHRLLVAISPGIGKSTMLALYSAWRLAKRRDWSSEYHLSALLCLRLPHALVLVADLSDELPSASAQPHSSRVAQRPQHDRGVVLVQLQYSRDILQRKSPSRRHQQLQRCLL